MAKVNIQNAQKYGSAIVQYAQCAICTKDGAISRLKLGNMHKTGVRVPLCKLHKIGVNACSFFVQYDEF